MEKRLLFTLHLLLITASGAFSQGLRHSDGIGGIEAAVFITGNGLNYQANYSKYITNRIYVKGGLHYRLAETTYRDVINTNVHSIYADIQGAYTLFTIKNMVFVNAVGGITGGTDLIAVDTEKTVTSFGYGVLIGTEIEVFFTDRLALLLDANQRFLFKAEVAKLRYQVGAGIKVCF